MWVCVRGDSGGEWGNSKAAYDTWHQEKGLERIK